LDADDLCQERYREHSGERSAQDSGGD
jgi:hypothetical protein